MFDFEKLTAYTKAKEFSLKIKRDIISLKGLDSTTKDQLRRASLSIVLNIAESASRFSNADKRNFYVIARGSLIESIAVLDLLKDDLIITKEFYLKFYNRGEELSKMLIHFLKDLRKNNTLILKVDRR